MKHIKKRISKIVDEIMTYLLTIGATNINVNVEDREKDYKITIASDYIPAHKEKIQKLIDGLKSPKQEEMEEYYWELTGESDCGTEFHLVGMMIDKVEIDVKEGNIQLQIYRYK